MTLSSEALRRIAAVLEDGETTDLFVRAAVEVQINQRLRDRSNSESNERWERLARMPVSPMEKPPSR